MKFTNIKPESYSLTNINNNSYCVSQPFQINSSYDPTIDFFKSIYTYPPKISLKFRKLDDFSRFNELSTALFLPDNGALETTFRLKTLPKNPKEKKSTKALEVVPAYVILNGQRELVVSSSPSNIPLEFDSQKDAIPGKIKKISSSKISKSSKLGLVFMSRGDAEAYLNDALNQWDSNAKTVGLAVHCVSLSSVYDAMHNGKVDIRLVPDMKELDLLLNKYKSKSNLIFDKLQHQSRRRFQALPFTPRIKNFYLGDKATPFYKFVSSNDYFKGVPIYIVQVQNSPRNIVVESGRNIFSNFETLISPVTKIVGTSLGMGERSISQGSIQNLVISDDGKDYIFFNYQQAKSFSKKYARSVKHFNSAKFLKTGFLAKKPCIHVLNLEDYLEIKDFNNVKKDSSTLEYPVRHFQFVASTQFDQAFDSIISKSISKSSWEKYIENLFIKTKVFKSLLSNIFEL